MTYYQHWFKTEPYFIIYYENTNFIMLVGINSTKQIEISNFTYGTKWDK